MEQLMLISIKTKYANQIFNGTKIYEYRRKSIGEKNCNKKIFVYSSEEEKAIVGYIIVDKILEGNIDYILEATNNKNSGSARTLAIRKLAFERQSSQNKYGELITDNNGKVISTSLIRVKQNSYIVKSGKYGFIIGLKKSTSRWL